MARATVASKTDVDSDDQRPLITAVTYWRLAILVVLFAAPMLVFAGFGSVALWQNGQLFWLSWTLPPIWLVAYLLARRWRHRLLPQPGGEEFPPPSHWSPRDEAAWQVVEKYQQTVADVAPPKLIDPHFYLQTAIEVSTEIARCYHPAAADPLSSLTVPEILAAAQLAIEDCAEWVDRNVPGSHVLSVNHWRMLTKAPDWIKTASNVSWAVSLVFQPLNFGRFLASRMAMNSATKQVRENVLAWFYVFFLRRVGFYAIEMNSGRLRGGTARYRAFSASTREAMDAATAPTWESSTAGGKTQTPRESSTITIAVVGQINAGKSSLINALLGQQHAAVDVLPLTLHVRRYQRIGEDGAPSLTLLDTGGYGAAGASDAQLRDIEMAASAADLLLLVMHAAEPTRQLDLTMLKKVRDWYRTQPQLKPPPVIGVLTHIDCLRPVMHWEPPYDWQSPQSDKERSIAAACEYNAREFGDLLVAIVPVCTDEQNGRSYGVEQWLLPTINERLGQARACGLIRSMHDELKRGKAKRVLRQLSNAGRGLLRTLLRGRDVPPR